MFSFIVFFHYYFYPHCSNYVRMEDMLLIEDIVIAHRLLKFLPILKLTCLVL
jgi:hypothetical protein